MIAKLRYWLHTRKLVKDSGLQVFASRKTTFPLEDCTKQNLLTAAAYNRRQAKRYQKIPHWKANYQATVEWNELAADAITALSLKLKDGQRVRDLPIRKRKREVERLLRITKGKAK